MEPSAVLSPGKCMELPYKIHRGRDGCISAHTKYMGNGKPDGELWSLPRRLGACDTSPPPTTVCTRWHAPGRIPCPGRQGKRASRSAVAASRRRRRRSHWANTVPRSGCCCSHDGGGRRRAAAEAAAEFLWFGGRGNKFWTFWTFLDVLDRFWIFLKFL